MPILSWLPLSLSCFFGRFHHSTSSPISLLSDSLLWSHFVLRCYCESSVIVRAMAVCQCGRTVLKQSICNISIPNSLVAATASVVVAENAIGTGTATTPIASNKPSYRGELYANRKINNVLWRRRQQAVLHPSFFMEYQEAAVLRRPGWRVPPIISIWAGYREHDSSGINSTFDTVNSVRNEVEQHSGYDLDEVANRRLLYNNRRMLYKFSYKLEL